MGFISFNEQYYRQKLAAYESAPLSADALYEARQLLKVLDDLTDEGYTTLNDRMEADFSCLTRLRAVIYKAGGRPFPIAHDAGASHPECNPFAVAIRDYSQWLGYEEDTAYIFLLRDALLPYLYFSARSRRNLYPWLISRRFLEDVTGTPFIDDDIRLPLYEALEQGHTAFDDFCAYCAPKIRQTLDTLPELKEVLLQLLGTIPQQKIIVVESGYMGTIPMMLKSLDSRVDFRLYTTAPFLYDTYRDKIYCRRYEDIRRFETLSSQDQLMQYAGFRDGHFYVTLSDEAAVLGKSFEELTTALGKSKY